MAQWSSRQLYTDSNVDLYAPASGGVYRLIYQTDDGHYVFFVGQSDDLQKRFCEHLNPSEPNQCIKTHLQNYRCYFRFIEIAAQTERGRIEKTQIVRYQPPCNV